MSYFNNELEFQTWLIKDMKMLWAYVRNIPDIWMTRKPFDVSANYLGKWLALELKIDYSKTASTPDRIYKKLYPHQIANLLEFKWKNSQWISIVLSYHAREKNVYVYDIINENDKVWLKEIKIVPRENWCSKKILDLFF